MSSKKYITNYYIYFLSSLLVCLSIQATSLHWVGGKTTKSESNYFSSLARIQTGSHNKPSVMLVGSSITGRLPDRINGFTGIANMGCDGGCAVDVLRAIDEGNLPSAPLLIIEGNTLGRALESNKTEISKAIPTTWFKAGMIFPAVSATARPAAFFYSKLLAAKIGIPGSIHGEMGFVKSLPFIPLIQGKPIQQELIEELIAIIKRLEKRGTSCWVVIYPPKITQNTEQYDLPLSLAQHAGIKFWDLGQELPDDIIKFTDGVHMDPNSAAITVRELVRAIRADKFLP